MEKKVTRLVSRITSIATAFLVAVFSVNVLAVMDVHAANNGTLKVHEKGTFSGTESNDPKVCKFNFEGFNFDRNQSGFVVIATQPGGVDTLTIPFGPANVIGYAATAYINDGGLTLADGQYKATLYGKSANNLPNFNDEKAKSKVFKVGCVTAQPTVAIQPPQCIQRGAVNGEVTVTVTNTDDFTDKPVLYTITATHQTNPLVTRVDVRLIADGESKTFDFGLLIAGTYNVTVTGNDGTTATTTFEIAVCNTPVTPAAPTNAEFCGTAQDTYTVPSTTGVTYLVNGVATPAGTYNGVGSVTITAVANQGYAIQGTASWTFTFDATPCVISTTAIAPTADDICGASDDSYEIPAATGVVYKVNGTVKPAGSYAANGTTVTITAEAAPGYVLTNNVKEWTLNFTTDACPEANITATADCSAVGVRVILTNDGDADGDVSINGDTVNVPAMTTVEVTVPFTSLFKADVMVIDQNNVLIDQAFDCTPGRGGMGDQTPITTIIPTVVKSTATLPAELPTTGTGTWSQYFIMMILAVTTYGAVYFLQGRLDFQSKK